MRLLSVVFIRRWGSYPSVETTTLLRLAGRLRAALLFWPCRNLPRLRIHAQTARDRVGNAAAACVRGPMQWKLLPDEDRTMPGSLGVAEDEMRGGHRATIARFLGEETSYTWCSPSQKRGCPSMLAPLSSSTTRESVWSATDRSMSRMAQVRPDWPTS